ncbi:EboA domain-containing protein [Actinoplanes sp. TFC3]|uniref:EboA domain-containing protein n=1 Tax=Actinoplanes sp. TFC3 TaxID=1710355 RepID=UPI00082DF82F|nr:EboA domain-containing protein [Actinoplanes sp. TFC3]
MTPDDLRTLVDAAWLDDAKARVAKDPQAIGPLFASAGRKLGRQPLAEHPGWNPGQAGRVLLLLELGEEERIADLYWQGDPQERLAVLHALPYLTVDGVALAEDALRTNDPRLVAAALGPYADHLDDATWRQGVVKCVFMGVPLSVVHRLDERADAKLGDMLQALAQERAAAGRRMPLDAITLLNRQLLTKED